jgi:hypothetical protein
MGFDDLWADSTPYFWRMFGLRLLIGLPIFLLVVILLTGLGFAGFSAFSGGVTGGGLAALLFGMIGVFIAVMCVIGLIGMVISMVTEQAENAIVLEDLGVLEGLTRGWHVFTANLLPVILITISTGMIGWVVSMLAALPLIAILIPAGMGFFISGGKDIMMPLIVGAGCAVLYLPVLLTLGGILQAYIQTVWTLTFRRLTTSPAPARPEQVFFE